jgi:hypothetical protein
MEKEQFMPRTEHLEGSFGGTKPDMKSWDEVRGLLARYEAFEAENRVEQWERLGVVVQEKLDGLNVSVYFQSEHQPVLNWRSSSTNRTCTSPPPPSSLPSHLISSL